MLHSGLAEERDAREESKSPGSSPATEKQVAFMVKMGVEPGTAARMTRHVALKHIARIISERKGG